MSPDGKQMGFPANENFQYASIFIDKKVNDTTEKETTMLTKFLGEKSSAIRLTFGEPNKIDLEVPYKIYTYYKKNLLIKCTREFFINPKTDLVEKFNSKNCIQ